MNLQNAIVEYIAAPGEYAHGLHLLEQTGCSQTFLTLLQRGENSYTRRKLESLLTDWLGTVRRAEEPQIGNLADQIKDSSPTKATARQELERQAYGLMDERSEYKARIRAVLDDPERQADRRDWAFAIKRLTREIDALYERRSFLDEHGYLPPDEVQLRGGPQETTAVEDRNTLLNIRTYISRYKKKVKEAKTPAVRQEAQRLLNQYETERDRLEKVLAHAV